MNKSRYLWFLVISMLCLFSGFSQVFQVGLFSPYHFEEPSDIRNKLKDYILSSVYIAKSAPSGILYSDVINKNVEFRVIEKEQFFYQVIVPEYTGIYPLYSQGSYIIKRDKENGEYIQAKIFLKSEASCFARIFPQSERSILQVYLYDQKIGDDIILPVAFEEILFMPFDEIISLTSNKLPWDIVWPYVDPANDIVRRMAERIAPHLSMLNDEDDGAMSSDGSYVYIETGERQSIGGLNCSGFAKWVVDGLYKQTNDRLLDIEYLKQKHMHLRGNSFSQVYEDERDPYFGLDWTRNLASAVSGGGYESSDVRNVRFHRYTEDVGYKVSELSDVLYQLAVSTPGRFYLGSVNIDYGEEPKLRQHVHVVVLFPYLTSTGELTVRVMERNMETGIESLKRRYQNGFIHLVHIEAAEHYTPFEIVTRLE